jgi:hypothetical protein
MNYTGGSGNEDIRCRDCQAQVAEKTKPMPAGENPKEVAGRCVGMRYRQVKSGSGLRIREHGRIRKFRRSVKADFMQQAGQSLR